MLDQAMDLGPREVSDPRGADLGVGLHPAPCAVVRNFAQRKRPVERGAKRRERAIGIRLLDARGIVADRPLLAHALLVCAVTGPDAFNSTLGIPPRPPCEDSQHDLFSALIKWADGGEAPDRVVATRFSGGETGRIDMQRPLCPYPQRAVYRGTGLTAAASSFRCEAASD
jgi:hypothetical protein